ncbi:MAG TPA: von Willebrand factor type A domain-containing protein [Anaerolineaceae bacterium]|nr:von Willebrand factor type A domain-containing protein [Anaerolineaceae bacterium]HPN53881.1 von Willebrand factor type A domain-containing protein [Anaerolineaceae bacterium]
MNAKTCLIIMVVVTLFLSGCSTPTATPISVYKERIVENKVVETVVVEKRSEGQTYRQPPQPTSIANTGSAPSGSAYPDNQFEDYGVNGYEDPYSDNLSTFGLDVDTASYTMMRAYIQQQGILPPFDSVRVEEFVNYFDAGYASPEDGGFALYADAAPHPLNRSEVLLRVGVQGYRVSDRERKPMALTFVIDTSGSMGTDNRIGLVKDSLGLLVDQLDRRDRVSVVSFSSRASVVLNSTSGNRHSDIMAAIDSLWPTNNTNLEDGLHLGYELASEQYLPDGVNRVILLSDGVANSGITDPETILSYVSDFVDDGITLTSVGVGMGNFNDVLMEKLADRSNGNYVYVNDLDEARRLFVDQQVSGMLQVIAKDARIQVDFNPDVVASYRLLGYENRAIADEDFRNDEVDAGEIGAGMTAVALYAIQLDGESEGRIGTVQLRWEDPDTSEVIEINGNINTWDIARSFDEADPHFQLASVAALYAEVLRQSPYSRFSLSDLVPLASNVAFLLDENADANELYTLIRQASRMD